MKEAGPYSMDLGIKEIRFRLEKLAARHVISRGAIECVRDFRSWEDYAIDGLVYELTVRIPVRDGADLHVPADWWQHLKQRWFPAWAKRRWPVRMTTYQARAYYPELPFHFPQSTFGVECVVFVPEATQQPMWREP